MTFEDIQRANSVIKTTDIKGKAYAEVNQRIKAFRMVFPMGIIETQMVANEGGICIFRATVGVYADNGSIFVLGTGTAYEREGASNINKTSYIENCETSAVGRALGMAGFGIDTSVASYEEVQNAIMQQDELKNTIDPTKVGALAMLIEETGTDKAKLCEAYKVKGLPDMTLEQWKHAMDILTKRKETQNANGANAQG